MNSNDFERLKRTIKKYEKGGQRVSAITSEEIASIDEEFKWTDGLFETDRRYALAKRVAALVEERVNRQAVGKVAIAAVVAEQRMKERVCSFCGGDERSAITPLGDGYTRYCCPRRCSKPVERFVTRAQFEADKEE